MYEEFETTSFSAEGIVRTADGQEISFKLDIEMTRYYREETNVSLRAGDAVRKDPLVVNFDGTASQLSGQANRRFNFDLNGDGKAESLPQFASGSGYLALDLNRNGRIDSGKELFGPQSGNGFAELALLDNDGNGWIDENDKDYNRLEVWTPAEEGAGKLQTSDRTRHRRPIACPRRHPLRLARRRQCRSRRRQVERFLPHRIRPDGRSARNRLDDIGPDRFFLPRKPALANQLQSTVGRFRT